jgi:hypothetical protein
VGARYWGGLVVKRSFPSSSAQIGLVTVGWSLDSKWQWQWQIAAQYTVPSTYLRLLSAGLHDAAAGLLEVEGRSPDRVGLLQLALDLRGCAMVPWEHGRYQSTLWRGYCRIWRRIRLRLRQPHPCTEYRL